MNPTQLPAVYDELALDPATAIPKRFWWVAALFGARRRGGLCGPVA